ncbi:MAG: divalent-cation tolerance protein CutA [Spirochaetaceae bacterium]
MIREDTGGYVMVVTTIEPEKGRALAAGLVEARLAACVQVIPKVESFYVWQGKVASDPEAVLLCKTHRDRLADIERHFAEHHGYDVPELIAVPVIAGLDSYISWMGETLGPDSPRGPSPA